MINQLVIKVDQFSLQLNKVNIMLDNIRNTGFNCNIVDNNLQKSQD